MKTKTIGRPTLYEKKCVGVSVSMPPEVLDSIRADAEKDNFSVSQWLVRASLSILDS